MTGPGLRTGIGAARTAAEESAGGGGFGNTWAEREAAAHSRAVKALNRAKSIPPALAHDVALIGANVVDAQVEGGGIAGINAFWNQLVSAAVYHNLKTSPFGFSFLASLPVIQVAQFGRVGVKSPTASDQICFTTDRSITPLGLTRFLGFAYDGGAAIVPAGGIDLGLADANAWTWRATSDGITMILSRCGPEGGGAPLSTGSLPTSTLHFPSGAGSPAFIATTASLGEAVLDVVFSFQSPV